ncbi:recombinase family protein [Bacillus fungorum]|uniref:recombinase family protein n=1 Tax=Bacillus fungorum TaxID=2039284 RepID=UPI0033987C56
MVVPHRYQAKILEYPLNDNFVSIKDGIDTSTTMGQFLFHIFGAVAEMERAFINERVVSGVAAAKARGREGGRKKAHTPQ